MAGEEGRVTCKECHGLKRDPKNPLKKCWMCGGRGTTPAPAKDLIPADL